MEEGSNSVTNHDYTNSRDLLEAIVSTTADPGAAARALRATCKAWCDAVRPVFPDPLQVELPPPACVDQALALLGGSSRSSSSRSLTTTATSSAHDRRSNSNHNSRGNVSSTGSGPGQQAAAFLEQLQHAAAVLDTSTTGSSSSSPHIALPPVQLTIACQSKGLLDSTGQQQEAAAAAAAASDSAVLMQHPLLLHDTTDLSIALKVSGARWPNAEEPSELNTSMAGFGKSLEASASKVVRLMLGPCRRISPAPTCKAAGDGEVWWPEKLQPPPPAGAAAAAASALHGFADLGSSSSSTDKWYSTESYAYWCDLQAAAKLGSAWLPSLLQLQHLRHLRLPLLLWSDRHVQKSSTTAAAAAVASESCPVQVLQLLLVPHQCMGHELTAAESAWGAAVLTALQPFMRLHGLQQLHVAVAGYGNALGLVQAVADALRQHCPSLQTVTLQFLMRSMSLEEEFRRVSAGSSNMATWDVSSRHITQLSYLPRVVNPSQYGYLTDRDVLAVRDNILEEVLRELRKQQPLMQQLYSCLQSAQQAPALQLQQAAFTLHPGLPHPQLPKQALSNLKELQLRCSLRDLPALKWLTAGNATAASSSGSQGSSSDNCSSGSSFWSQLAKLVLDFRLTDYNLSGDLGRRIRQHVSAGHDAPVVLPDVQQQPEVAASVREAALAGKQLLHDALLPSCSSLQELQVIGTRRTVPGGRVLESLDRLAEAAGNSLRRLVLIDTAPGSVPLVLQLQAFTQLRVLHLVERAAPAGLLALDLLPNSLQELHLQHLGLSLTLSLTNTAEQRHEQQQYGWSAACSSGSSTLPPAAAAAARRSMPFLRKVHLDRCFFGLLDLYGRTGGGGNASSSAGSRHGSSSNIGCTLEQLATWTGQQLHELTLDNVSVLVQPHKQHHQQQEQELGSSSSRQEPNRAPAAAATALLPQLRSLTYVSSSMPCSASSLIGCPSVQELLSWLQCNCPELQQLCLVLVNRIAVISEQDVQLVLQKRLRKLVLQNS